MKEKVKNSIKINKDTMNIQVQGRYISRYRIEYRGAVLKIKKI